MAWIRVADQLDVTSPTLANRRPLKHIWKMRKSDIICPKCHAGYRRIELASRPGTKGEFRCLLCDQLLEVFDGSTEVAIRLTVQPEKTFE
jgi:hypothetical protein